MGWSSCEWFSGFRVVGVGLVLGCGFGLVLFPFTIPLYAFDATENQHQDRFFAWLVLQNQA
jgi:hypothetical protein